MKTVKNLNENQVSYSQLRNAPVNQLVSSLNNI